MYMYSSRYVNTKKIHSCFACNRKFAGGTRLIKWACVTEDGFSHGYMCPTCLEIINLAEIDEAPSGITLELMNNDNLKIEVEQYLEVLKIKKELKTMI